MQTIKETANLQPLYVYIVRHLRPLVPKGYAYGALEVVPLNKTGPKTLEALNAIANTLPDEFTVVSSPSPRAQDTTEEILKRKDKPAKDYITDARFLEQNWGAWQGKYYHEIPPDELEYYLKDEDTRAPPGGETLNELLERVGDGLNDYAKQYIAGGLKSDALLICAHGGVARAAFAFAAGKPVSDFLGQKVQRLSLNIIKYDPDAKEWSIVEPNISIHPA